MALGLAGRWRPLAAARPIGPARLLAGLRRTAGHGGGRQSGAGRSLRQSDPDRLCRDSGRGGRGHVRYRDRRLSHRNVEARTIGRRVGHVAIWLAHRIGRGGCLGTGAGGADRLAGGLYGLRHIRVARHADRPVTGRTGTASRSTGAPGRERVVAIHFRTAARIFPPTRGDARAAVHSAPQDRRHAGEPDLPPAVRRYGLQQ